MKRFSELLTEAALPKKEPAKKAEPTPTESAESLSKKAVNTSRTADQAPSTAPYADQHAAHLAAADAHHEAANAHVGASQGNAKAGYPELHAMHAQTHRSVARNHERAAAVYAMGAAQSKPKTVKEEADLTEALEIITELKKDTLASYVTKAAGAVDAASHASTTARASAKNAKTSGFAKHMDRAANYQTSIKNKRLKGIATAVNKLAEELCEAHDGIDAGLASLEEAVVAARGPRPAYDASADIEAGKKRLAQRKAAHLATLSRPPAKVKMGLSDEAKAAREAAKKDMREEYLTELSKKTLASYTKKAAMSMASSLIHNKDEKALKRLKGINKSTTKLSEEVLEEGTKDIDHLTLRASKGPKGETRFHDKNGPITGKTYAEMKAHVQKAQELRVQRSAAKNVTEEHHTQYEMNLRAERLKRVGERFRKAMGQDIPNPVED